MARADFKKFYNRGRQLAQKNRFSDAIAAFETALEVKPGDPDTIFQLGNMSKAMHFYDMAIKWYDVASSLKPDSIEIAFNRAHALQLTGRNNEALQAYADVAPLMHSDPMLWNNLGTLYQQMSLTADAIDALERAVSLKPAYYDAWNNLGLSYFIARTVPRHAGKWTEAFEKAERGYAKDPHFHVNRATCYFWDGYYSKGWADYAFRHDPKIKSSVKYDHTIPWWKGEDLTGKTILIGEEQGIGDQITFISAVADIAATAKKVIVEVNPKIISLVQRSLPNVDVIKAKAETIDLKRHHAYDWLTEPVDFFAPLGDAFYYSKPSLDTFRAKKPFLIADPALKKNWAERLLKLNTKPKVGISWRSSKMTGERQGGYFDLEMLLPFLEKMSDFQFVNIQYGDCTDELAAMPKRADGTDLIISYADLDLFDDIEGTAALIESLDFVISVRNTQACFAGGLGKKTITYHGSFMQFGRHYTDPVYPYLLATYPHENELPILTQLENALCHFDTTYHLCEQQDETTLAAL
ncbi:tetratricopeptide repeat protein [Kordiimonas pumila]|uniref:Tetratricopeptide repeat protein n=1 Tax=Kordiimonas pumila TaxID=2161677 RepID=A0ABV7D986_9PROT|nr:tetratricopeptide repeat protein [Kordiimonas pumila]